jgi:hypothetical protein
LEDQDVYSVKAHLSIDRESIVIEIIPNAKSEFAHVCIFAVKDFSEDEDSQGAKQEDLEEILEGTDRKYRIPYEIDIYIFRADEHRPFNYVDADDVDENNIQGEELQAFEFTKKGLKVENEMEGINVRSMLIIFR